MNIWAYFRFGCYLHSSSSVFLPAPSLPAPSLPAPSLPTPSLPTPSLPTPSSPTHLVPTLYSNSQVHLLSSFVFHFSFNSPSPLTSLSPLAPFPSPSSPRFTCRDECDPGDYISEEGVCEDCHLLCEQCVGPGPSNCTSCRDSR